VLYVTPSLILEPTGTDRIVGQPLELDWLTYADQCFSSGGAPGDGWDGNAFATPTTTPNLLTAPNGFFAPTVTTAGTYTYTLTCSSGPISVQQSVTVAFENNAPYTTASLSTTSVTYSMSPADYVNLNWNSNVSSCNVDTTPGNNWYTLSDPLMIANQAQGSAILAPPGPGTYTITVICVIAGPGTQVPSQPLTLTVLPPPPPTATFSITPSTVVAGQSFTMSYSSTNALDCAEVGSIPGTWGTTSLVYNEPPTGSFSLYTNDVAQYTLGMSCQSIDPNQGTASAQAQLTVLPFTDSLSVVPTSLNTGDKLTLTWSSNGTRCIASGGGANGTPWSGSLPPSGSVTQTATTTGFFTYSVQCFQGHQNGVAQASINVSAAPAASSSSGGSVSGGGGHGGGGGVDLLDVALLAALGILRGGSDTRARKSRAKSSS